MKIVDPNPDPSVTKHVVCWQCGVKLSYVPADTKEGKRTDYTGDTDFYNFIQCPNCKAEVRL